MMREQRRVQEFWFSVLAIPFMHNTKSYTYFTENTAKVFLLQVAPIIPRIVDWSRNGGDSKTIPTKRGIHQTT